MVTVHKLPQSKEQASYNRTACSIVVWRIQGLYCTSSKDVVLVLQEVLRYLYCSEQGHGSGVIDDSLSKHQAVEQRAVVLLQHLKHRH